MEEYTLNERDNKVMKTINIDVDTYKYLVKLLRIKFLNEETEKIIYRTATEIRLKNKSTRLTRNMIYMFFDEKKKKGIIYKNGIPKNTNTREVNKTRQVRNKE